MKAISLWQPWATLIAIGAKTIETRSWPTKYRGPLAIHAAKKWNSQLQIMCQSSPFVQKLAGVPLPRGVIVCTCNLVDCQPVEKLAIRAVPQRAFGNYSPGRFGWILENITPLSSPIPCVGRQGFFQFDAQPLGLLFE